VTLVYCGCEIQGDHFSGKPGNVKKLTKCQGKAREVSEKNVVMENCPLLASRLGLCRCSVGCLRFLLPFLKDYSVC